MTDDTQQQPVAAAEKPKKRQRGRDRKPRKRAVKGKASVTNPTNVAAALVVAKALEMRAEGKTYVEIAAECGYNSRQAVHRAITKALMDIKIEHGAHVKTLELIRLEKMFELPYLNAQTGDNFAIASCLRIMERRSRLLGLDAPVRTEGKLQHDLIPGGVLVVPAGVSEEEWAKEAALKQQKLRDDEASVRLDEDDEG